MAAHLRRYPGAGVSYVSGVTAPDSPAPADATAPTGRIVLLTTSQRVAPGLLSWPAWQALRGADRVLSGDPDHPQLPY